MGELYVCAGGVDILKVDKKIIDLWCFIVQIGWLGALYGWAKPTKAPCDNETGYQQTSISKTVLPNHVRSNIRLFNAQQ